MKTLGGVLAAAITPRRPGTQEIDLGAMWELFDLLESHHVNGLVLMGSTGEFPHFSIEERNRMVGLAVRRSRVPVVVNVSHSTLDGALLLARAAASMGAAALLLMPPIFFRYTQAELEEFFRLFAASAKFGTPLLLYNIPLFAERIEMETAATLLKEGLYSGIKDSSGEMAGIRKLRELTQGETYTLLAGNDAVFSYAKTLGANGVISGVACAVPELLLALNRARDTGHAAAEQTAVPGEQRSS